MTDIRRSLRQTTACLALTLALTAPAMAGPSGGIVIGGAATIETSGSQTTITQSSDRGIVKWSSFDVGANESVRFKQPGASSVTVNRIMDSKASTIDGSITANGNVVLINPNGILFGAGSRVDVGGLIATTSDLASDQAFMAGGALQFTKPGNPDASVVNNGAMTVRDAGLAGLVAPHVQNNGTIQATLGKVALASGDVHYIDLAGDGLISLAVSGAVAAQSVSNTGTVQADGGTILVTAAQARGLVDAVVTNTGTLRADTVGRQTGSITVSTKGVDNPATTGRGTANIGGTVQAAGTQSGQAGGAITVLGDTIHVDRTASLDASGAAAGGTINIGGAYQGGSSLPAAQTLTVADGARIDASATDNGNGGNIVLWSDGATDFYAQALARGGVNGGDGGTVEISGKGTLDFAGAVDTRAPLGETGTLLLDPTNIVISSASNQNVTGTATVQPNADDVPSVLNATTLQNTLATSSVNVQTRATGSQAGTITVSSPVTWASANTLTLTAASDITINGAISGKNLTLALGGDLFLNAALNGTGTLTVKPTNNQTFGIGTGQAGALSLNDTEIGLFNGHGWSSVNLGYGQSHGALNVGAMTWSNPLTLSSGTSTPIHINGAQAMGANNLSFITDSDPDIGAALTGNGTGTLTVTSYSTNTSFGIAGGSGTINLSAAELDRLSGWSQLNIGALSSAPINIGAYSNWKQKVFINGGSGGINISGAQDFKGNSLDIFTTTGLNITADLTHIYDLTIVQRDLTKTIGIGTAAGDIQLNQAALNHLFPTHNFNTGYSTTGYAALNIANATFGSYTFVGTNLGAINLAGNIASSYSGASTRTSLVFRDTSGTDGGDYTFAPGTVINPGTGRYVVYSRSPLLDTYNGFARTQKRYNSNSSNYATGSITQTGNIFLYNVAPALTVTLDSKSRQYGDANPAFSYSVSGMIDGDSAAGAVSVTPSTAANATSNVGSYAITAATASAMNYQVSIAPGAALNVTKAPLVATADDKTRAYGDADPAFTVSYTGFKNGETASVIDTPAIASTAATATTNVGTAVITASGALDNNYDFTYAPGTLTIGKATLIATADDKSRYYGDANPVFTVSYAGFKNGENSGVIDTLAIAGSAAAATTNAGTTSITVAGAADNNYDFTYVPGTLTIHKAVLTATADDQSRTFGTPNPPLTVSYAGFKNGESAAVLDTAPQASTAAASASPAGPWTIAAAGGADNNYDFTYVNGTLTILPAPASVTVTPPRGPSPSSALFSGLKQGQTGDTPDTRMLFASETPDTYTAVPWGTPPVDYSVNYNPGSLTLGRPPHQSFALNLSDPRQAQAIQPAAGQSRSGTSESGANGNAAHDNAANQDDTVAADSSSDDDQPNVQITADARHGRTFSPIRVATDIARFYNLPDSH